MQKKEKIRPGIQSVEIATRILVGMSQGKGLLPLKEIARISGLHPGKAHRYLVSLTRGGLVFQDGASGHYGIGPQSIALGLAGLRILDVTKSVGEVLPVLRDRTGETALFSLWTKAGPVVVQLAESERPIFMNVRVGSVLPLSQTATGHVFLTYLPASDTHELLKAELSGRRPRVTGRQFDLEAVTDRTRDQGYAAIFGNLVPGVAVLAAPIFEHRGRVCAVIGIVGREEDLAGKNETKASQVLLEVADSISHRMGFQGGDE
jgi:DNA-binding IclR family transcriptional regulator